MNLNATLIAAFRMYFEEIDLGPFILRKYDFMLLTLKMKTMAII